MSSYYVFVLLAQRGSPMLPWCSPGSIHLIGKHREPAVVTEVHPAANNACRAHDAARFRGCVCITELNTINLQCQVLTIKSWFFAAQLPWVSHTSPQSGSLIPVTNKYQGNAAKLSRTLEEFKAKSEPEN